MTLNPQIDTDIIYEMLLSDGIKENSAFRLNRLDKAIQSMTKLDYEQGIKLTAYFLAYKNQLNDAFSVIDSFLIRLPNSIEIKQAKASVSIMSGNWMLMKSAFLDYSQSTPLNEDWQRRIAFYSLLFEDNTLLTNEYSQQLKNLTSRRESLSISLDIYRQAVGLMVSTLFEVYDGDANFSVDYHNRDYIAITAKPYINIDTANKLTDTLLSKILNSGNETLINQSESLVMYYSAKDSTKVA